MIERQFWPDSPSKNIVRNILKPFVERALCYYFSQKVSHLRSILMIFDMLSWDFLQINFRTQSKMFKACSVVFKSTSDG